MFDVEFNPKGSILDEQLAESGLEMNFLQDLLTGGAHSRNEAAKSSAKRQNKYNKQVYKYQWRETKRQHEYAVESLNIAKYNNEVNLQFQEYQAGQRYDYDMGIRAYEFAQANRAYDKSVSTALNNVSFTKLATQAALSDQNRLYHEQMIDLALDETQTLFNYGMAAAGIGLKRQSSKVAAVAAAQQGKVATLKETGAAQARGVSGRSAAANIQGMLAESGANQRNIVDTLMFDLEASDQELFNMNKQLVMDQVGFELSRESAMMSNISAVNKIKAQSLQALIDAAASIELKPEIAPPMPRPVALPRPVYQDVYEPKKPPKPLKNVAAQENLWAAGISRIGTAAAAAVSAGAGVVAAGAAGSGLATQAAVTAGLGSLLR